LDADKIFTGSFGASFDAAIRLSPMARLDLPCRCRDRFAGNLALRGVKRLDWDARR